MSELTEISNADLQYPYNAHIPSLSGVRNIKFNENDSFEQLSILTSHSSLEETVERCVEKCKAKLERAKSLTSKKL